MPELPEVETIKRDLEKQVLGKEICDMRILLPRAFENLHNTDVKGIINQISRIGKYLIIKINNLSGIDFLIVIHLRMTGKLIYHHSSKGFDEKHTRVVFLFNDGACLIFNDVRTFGKIEIVPINTRIESLKKIGIDALSEHFTFKLFYDICKSKKTPIKNLLLDQTLIAGIGNIYAQEILFLSKIMPTRPANSLKKKEIKDIYQNTKDILELAIQHNGTSISDFRRVDDKTGDFQNFLKVYGKKNCCICYADLIKIKQAGRSTTFCQSCQK
ncbi:MAG: DNA-formamidopyrimidine glycosylase [Candidatus Cloacimonetes bacterium]|nr:DNA-formamidopyrimidine glycosylase [Candidatus Cloacimonadota bacterium]